MLKKFSAAVLAALCLAALPAAEAAYETEYEAVFLETEDNIADVSPIPVEFRKTDGQFIYCNNPEFISEKDLSTDENPSPTYMMKNEELGPDTYYVFFCFYNWTDFDVEPDIEFVSGDAVITINSVGYYIPQDYDAWDCIGAWSDLMGLNIRTFNGYQEYVPYRGIDLPKTFSLSGGSEWISKYIYNYEPVSPKVTFNMLVSFTIEEGSADVNCAALKSYDAVGDRTHHVSGAAPGVYKNDTSIKGIETESGPVVEADLDIKITPDVKDGERLPVKIFNQYFPDGNVSDFWMTNINPSRDMYYYSKEVAAGSDMLSFKLKDDTKEQYYGKNVTERDDIWYFDIYHYNTLGYEHGMPWKAEEHIPNAYMGDTLDINNLPDIRWQLNLGNFGAACRYNLTITNSDKISRTLNYMLETSISANIVTVRDENGNILNPYTLREKDACAVCKGINSQKTEDCMVSIRVPAGQTVRYTVDVILPTNSYGGIVNYLIADSKKYLSNKNFTEFPEYTEYYNYKNSFFNGEELMKWEDGELYRNDEGVWKRVKLSDEAKEIFASRTKDIRLVKTPAGYAARFGSWDEYGNNIEDKTEKMLYLFDRQFNLINDIEFDSYINYMVYADGAVYIKTRDMYVSTDGISFKKLTDGYDVPRANGAYAIFKKQGDFYMTGQKERSKMAFESRKPDDIYSSGGIFWRYLSWKNYDDDTETGNVLAVSSDGVNWQELYFPNRVIKIRNMEYIGNILYVYAKYETFVFENVIPKDNIKVNFEGEYLVFDVSAKVINDRTMTPLRFFFEKLGAKVDWIDETREIIVTYGETEIRLQIDSSAAFVNGEEVYIDVPPLIDNDKTLIPIRFLSENLGYEVEWEQKSQTAVISRPAVSPSPVPTQSSKM